MSDAPSTAATPPVALACHDITVSYGERRVLDGLSINLDAGSWTAIVGPNGCGKSTLLRTLAGLITPDRGRVSLFGRPILEWPRRQRARRLAWLAQSIPPSDLTATECVALGRFAHTGWLGSRHHADQMAIERALAATGSAAWGSRRLNTLSGGERQRVNLARALAVEASVLLLDEPTTHLDPPHQEDIARVMRQQAHGCGVTVVSAIHDLSLALLADQLIVMGASSVVGHGNARDVLQNDWLSQAFGTSIKLIEQQGSYLWSPDLRERSGG